MKIIAWDQSTDKAISPQRAPKQSEWCRITDGERVTKRPYSKPVEVVEVVNEKLVSIGDIINNLPLGTKRKLTKISETDDGNGDIADLILMFMTIGNPVDVNGEGFNRQADWMVSNPDLSITEDHIQKIKSL